MQLRWNRFEALLEKGSIFAPCYVFYGDEACIQMELRDVLLKRLVKAGFEKDSPFAIDSGHTDWSVLNEPLSAMSLFSSKTVLDVRVNTEKLSAEGAKWLANLPACWHEDIVVVLTLPKLDKVALNSAWFKGLDQGGGVMVITPALDRSGFKEWLEYRAAQQGLEFEPTALVVLLHTQEGNLFGARQVFERLKLIGHQGKITVELLEQHTENAARYEVQQLSEAWLTGKAERCIDILAMLRREPEVFTLVLWQLGEDIHAWWAMSQRKAPVMLWGGRKVAMEQRVHQQKLQPKQFARCVETLVNLDHAVKGLRPDEPNVWDQLETTIVRWAKSAMR